MPTNQDYFNMSAAAYTAAPNVVPTAPSGWSVMTNPATNQPFFSQNASAGFQAVAFQNNSTGQIVVAFEGTNPTAYTAMALGTVGADINIVKGVIPSADGLAAAFTNQVLDASGNNQVFLTGHSLGGEEAQYVASQLGSSIDGGVTFGAPGVPTLAAGLGLNSNFTNYADSGDVVGNYNPTNGDHFGNLVTVSNANDGAYPQIMAQLAANASSEGNTTLATIYGLGVVGTVIGDHMLTEYALDMNLDNNPTSNSSTGGADEVLTLNSVYGVNSGGAGGNGPTIQNGTLYVNGYTELNSSNYIMLSDSNGAESYINTSTNAGQTFNAAQMGVSSIEDLGSGNTLDTGSTGDYEFSGVGDTLNNFLAATADLSIVNGSANQINILANSSTEIDGPDTVNINPANADSLDLFDGPVTFNTGTGTPFSPSQLAILNGFNGGLSTVTMNSNTDATYSGSDQNVNIAGTNITANGINGGNVQTIGSAQAVLSGTNTSFKINAGSTTIINGSNDTSSITGSNTTLTQEGGGVVDVLGSSNVNSITGNNLNIYESQNAVIEAVYGNNNTVHITGGGGSKSQVADAAISGSPMVTDVFAPGGTGNTVSYDTFGSGSYGGYGFSEAPPTSGTNIGLIASYDAQLGDQSDASTALSAKLEAQSNVSSSSSTDTHTNTPEFEGVKWASKTITWSLATTYDPVGAQLSGLIGSQYLPLIQQAFHDWSVLSGLQFKQVAAAASPDIELGWSTFNPAVTGVLGYTGFRVINGAIQSGALISLENPTDDALAKDASGQLAYTGTQTELEQLLLHQIGQALGLADDADTKSIMYAVLSSKNRFFDATDMAGIQDLYDSSSVASPASTTVASDATTLSGSSPISVSASLVSNLAPSALTPFASEANQLINAMAVFNPSASPTTAYTPPTLASLASSMTLSASGH